MPNTVLPMEEEEESHDESITPSSQSSFPRPIDIISTVQFISKINQIILRARLGHRPDLKASVVSSPSSTGDPKNGLVTLISPPWMDVDELIRRVDFWKSGTPVNLDIFLRDSMTLLERWVVSYEPPSVSSSHHHHGHHHHPDKPDTTDLVLLTQSLYSYIRLMPLHTVLSESGIPQDSLKY
ncbi:hypothetical protein HDU76_011716, partial [Blyttiomyces sp. JEL0837]